MKAMRRIGEMADFDFMSVPSWHTLAPPVPAVYHVLTVNTLAIRV
jgi:hypothetical protein